MVVSVFDFLGDVEGVASAIASISKFVVIVRDFRKRQLNRLQ